MANTNLTEEELLYKRKNVFESKAISAEDAYAYCEGYKEFLDLSKTEREAVAYGVKAAEKEGFRPYTFGCDVKPGDKFYYNNRGKSLFLFVIGSEPIEGGIHIAAAHVDSPRVDLKQNPLYESDGLGYFKTHYYGGIKKYQWTALPLALHGVFVKEDGTTVDVNIGEDESDPVFYISDLLPHLAKDQVVKRANEVIEGEALNLIAGSEADTEAECAEKIKINLLKILNQKYGITEADFQSAELCAVPAFRARDVGLDCSMISSYGHDDRVCAYPALTALLRAQNPKKTIMAILADKEETGSNGATGMQCAVLVDLIEDLANTLGGNRRTVRQNSFCLSADVNAAYDPNFAGVYEKMNSAYLNSGVAISKYTGSRGKSDTNDASAEVVAKLRKMFTEGGVPYQMCELGKVDAGGGGTVAKYISEKNIDTIDAGVPVISMHSPYEVVSKYDVYSMYLGMCALFGTEA